MRLPSHGGVSQKAEFQRVDEQGSDELSRTEWYSKCSAKITATTTATDW